LVQGPTEEMILQEIDKLKIDLVVLGNKRHGILYSTFVGSVTDDLIHDLDIPVYLVPDK
jgi:nucleotide-binding universal stress UspA family protein